MHKIVHDKQKIPYNKHTTKVSTNNVTIIYYNGRIEKYMNLS